MNWTVLYDSAASGTYVEPKDGSGRTYGVGGSGRSSVEDQALQELEGFLEELFWEVGIESVGGDGVEINTSFTLSENQKSAIDRFIKKLIDTRWEKLVKALQEAIPKLKSKDKYSSNSRQVMLDYLEVSIEKQLEVTIIHNVSDTTQWWISWMEFEVGKNLQWKISNIWVQYIDWNGIKKNKKLDIQADGKYIVAFSQDSCKDCSNLKPYYLLSWRTDEVVAFLDEQVVVANSSYTQFVNILKYIWNWKGYTKEGLKQEVVDIKEDIVKDGKDISINIILQSIAKGSNLSIDTDYINVDTLPVSWYMLDKFLNHDDPYKWHKTILVTDKEDEIKDAILFESNSDISNHFKKSIDFNNILDLLNGKCNYNLYTEHENLEDRESVFCVKKDGSNFDIKQELDLYMAVNWYFFSLEIFRQNDKLYTKVLFWDEYDFEPNSYGTWLSDTLNYWWNYYEKELDWNTYWWAVEIINELWN